MPNLVPAYIMVPDEGEAVYCWGVDVFGKSFGGLLGTRKNGHWTLSDFNVKPASVTHWWPSLIFDQEQPEKETKQPTGKS